MPNCVVPVFKVSCNTNRLVSLEALLRWQHPEQGLISPGVFIPILEQSTLMEEVSLWVLRTVCQQIQKWLHEGLIFQQVAVNISGRDFMVKEISLQIAQILKDNQIEGQYLELELTETVLASNTERCITTMENIKELGVLFAIDDFGTGYSSMSYLKKFPINTLKIDRAFIQNCDSNKEDSAICKAIISLGKSLELKIVAEGVETQAQLDFLRQTECDSYQGYLFSRPLSVDDIKGLLTEQSSA